MVDTTAIPAQLPGGYRFKYTYRARTWFDKLILGSWEGRVHYPDRYFKGHGNLGFRSNGSTLYARTERSLLRKARRDAWREERARSKYERGERTVDL